MDDALSRFLVLKNFVILSQESVRHVPGSTASNLHEDLKDAFPPRFPSIPAEIIRWSPDEVEEGVMVS